MPNVLQVALHSFIHSIASGNSMTILFATLLPSVFVALGAGWKGYNRYTHWVQRRRRLMDLLLGTPPSDDLPGTTGLIEQHQQLMEKIPEIVTSINRIKSLAERANRVAVAAHKRLDRAGYPPSWAPPPKGQNDRG